MGCMAANAHRGRLTARHRRIAGRCAGRHPLGLGRAVLQTACNNYDNDHHIHDEHYGGADHVDDCRSLNRYLDDHHEHDD